MYDGSMNFVSKRIGVRQAIEFHRHRLEQELGVPLSESVVIEVDLDLTQVGAERNLGYDDPDTTPTRTLRRLRTPVAAIEIPGDFPGSRNEPGTSHNDLNEFLGGAKPKNRTGFRWGGCPSALRFHLKGLILVALNVSYDDGPGASYESTARLVIARSDCASETIRILTHIARRDRQQRCRSHGRGRSSDCLHIRSRS